MTFSPAHNDLFIDGGARRAENNATLPIENPAIGAVIGEIAAASKPDVDAAVAAARAALAGPWGGLAPVDRGRLLLKLSAAILDNCDALAHLETLDVGKPLKQSQGDARALARYFEYYAGAVDKFHGESIPYLPNYTVFTQYEPHGVTAHIIPWNYPMQIIGRSVVAALAMGNATVLKPAEQASLTSLAVARIVHEAGLPAGVLNVVTGAGPVAGQALAAHPDVNHVSFTGSVGVGSAIQAAAAGNAVSVTLELGGKSPHIVFDDADLEAALPLLVNAATQNAGQTCSAGSRILVQRGVYDQVVARLAARFRDLTVGPGERDLDLGPLISKLQQSRVLDYIELGRRDFPMVAQGRIVSDAPRNGYYVAPTLFAPVRNEHRLAQEEIFGPVAVVLPFETEEEAIGIANGTPYGLVAGIWSNSSSRLLRMAKRLKAGQVFLNDYGAAGGVELPFGGVGRSGYGREKGIEALRGFGVIKTIVARHG